MTLSVQKIGLNTQKISFGKGCDKGYSSIRSGYSSVNSLSSFEEKTIRENERRMKENEEKRIAKNKKEQTRLKIDLLDRLEKYADDPVMVRIITEQLRKLG